MLFDTPIIPRIVWLTVCILFIAVLSFIEFALPFQDRTDHKSAQFQEFKNAFDKEQDALELDHAGDFYFRYFGGTILRLLLVAAVAALSFAAIHLFCIKPRSRRPQQSSSESDSSSDKLESAFLDIGADEEVNKALCERVHRVMASEIKFNIKPNLDAEDSAAAAELAADYMRLASGGSNILTLIDMQARHGLNSLYERIFRLHESEWWGALLSAMVLAHILIAFLESGMRAPATPDCVDFFAPCNLEFKASAQLTPLERTWLTRARVAMGVFGVFYLVDMQMRLQLYSSACAPNNILTSRLHQVVCLLHLLIVAQMLVDNLVLELFFGWSLEFIFPMRGVLLIVRSERLTDSAAEVLSAVWKARHALFLFLNLLLLTSLFSMVLFGATWEFDLGAAEAPADAVAGREHARDLAALRERDSLVEGVLEDGVAGVAMNLFSDVLRSAVVMFVMIVSGENLVDVVYGTWANPIFGRAGVFAYWWLVIVLAMFLLTPVVVGAFVSGFEAMRGRDTQRRRALFRTSVVAAFTLADLNLNAKLSFSEFQLFMDAVTDADEAQLRRIFERDGGGSVSVSEFVAHVDVIFADGHFVMAPREHHVSRRRALLSRVATMLRIALLVAQAVALSLLSRGVLGANPRAASPAEWARQRSAELRIDAVLLLALLLHVADVAWQVLSQRALGFFFATLFRRNAEPLQLLNAADFFLVLGSCGAHMSVALSCLATAPAGVGALWLLPWHAWPAEAQVFAGADLVGWHRIWMSLTLLRLLTVVPFSRRIVHALLAAMRRMGALFAVLLALLLAFGVIGVTLFRAKSDYQGVELFDDLTSAFATFAQGVVGEAFYELLYASVVWRQAWAPLLYFAALQFVMAFLFMDLFFGLLLDLLTDMADDEEDDEDDEDEEQEAKQ